MKNNKGFTVVELIASFVFTSVLAITLFAAIMNYRDKQIDTDIATELEAFKSQLLIDIHQDIQKKGLYSITVPADCTGAVLADFDGTSKTEISDDDAGDTTTIGKVNRCVDMNFVDGTSKRLLVSRKARVDRLLNSDGSATEFSVVFAYISYGGVQYRIPDEDNIDLGTDYFFQKTEPSDELETNTPLYRVRIDLAHKDLMQNIVISFVANGSEYSSPAAAPYDSYSIGDLLTVALTDTKTAKFRVIEDSSGYNSSVKLLYDDVYDNTVVLNSTQYNTSTTVGNEFSGSKIESFVKYLSNVSTGLEITNIGVLSKTGNARQINAPSSSGLSFNLDLAFKNVNDSITYSITVKNNSNSNYSIKQRGGSSDSVRYSPSNEVSIAPGGTGTINLTFTYFKRANSTELNGSGEYTLAFPVKLIAFKNGAWYNADNVRLITEKEVEFIASTFILRDSLPLTSAPAWLTNKSYWTMSPKVSEGSNDKVWYVDSSTKELKGASVTSNYALRPVIEIDKQFIKYVQKY